MGKKKGAKKVEAPVSDPQATAAVTSDSQAVAKIEPVVEKPEEKPVRDLSVPHPDVCTPEAWGMQDPFARRCVVCKAEHETCYMQCGEYKAQLAAAKAEGADKKKAPRKRAAAPKSGGKVNGWGHRLGSQAQKIDDLLIEGDYTVPEIADMVETTKNRIQSHILHLRQVKGISVVAKEGKKMYAFKPVPVAEAQPAAQAEVK